MLLSNERVVDVIRQTTPQQQSVQCLCTCTVCLMTYRSTALSFDSIGFQPSKTKVVYTKRTQYGESISA